MPTKTSCGLAPGRGHGRCDRAAQRQSELAAHLPAAGGAAVADGRGVQERLPGYAVAGPLAGLKYILLRFIVLRFQLLK